MNKFKTFLKRFYRLSIGFKKQEELVWEDLKKLHTEAKWSSGVYDSEKYLETIFEIANQTPRTYYYMLHNHEYHSTVDIIQGFNPEKATDLFILASHFNNILKVGLVRINVNSLVVQFVIKSDILLPFIYKGEIYKQLVRHFEISKDIYWAYQRLLETNDEPTFIMADLLKKNESAISKVT